jgi:nucleoside-diphosphate-sugar epimerase
MRVLVTGGLGNLGTLTLHQLVQRGHEVHCFDLPTPTNQHKARRLSTAIRWQWGDIRDPDAVARSVADMDVVVHLAGILPPPAHDQPTLAESVNVGGTRNLLTQAASQQPPPHVLFASTLDVFGPTSHLPPPRTVDDPLVPTDNYSQHKILGEQMVRAAGIPWAIFRFADMPVLGNRPVHAMMFDIPLDTRIEVVHPADAALAIATGISTGNIWGKIWLIGGGPTCQLTYRTYLSRLLGALGIPMLPERAFGTQPYCTDWLDTAASEAALRYQRHTFDEIAADVARGVGLTRRLVPLVRPIVTRSLLRLSPYYRHKG